MFWQTEVAAADDGDVTLALAHPPITPPATMVRTARGMVFMDPPR